MLTTSAQIRSFGARYFYSSRARLVWQEEWRVASIDGMVDVFLTADQNLQYQHYLASITFSIIVLVERDNRVPTLLPLMSQVQILLDTITPGQLVEIRSLP